MKVTDKITITNEDNMKMMALYPDNYFDLAIVDPPYGIGNKLVDSGGTRKAKFDNNRDSVKWDKVPTYDYFKELFRVSKNQIIWGSNYFNLPPTRCNVIWDKMQIFTGSDFELAWTSFEKASRAFRMSRIEAYSKGKIHPTQKPVKLYEWLLMNYAKDIECKECDNGRVLDDDSDGSTIPCEYCNGTMKRKPKILDTHLGSGSIAIACHNLGYELTACELDKDYYEASIKRIKNHIAQQRLF